MADNDSEERHKCTECGKSYSKNWRLVEHIRSHTGERPYKCEYEGCGKFFIRPYHLKRHSLTHTGAASFKCSYPGCEQTFVLKHNLKRHERRSHNQPFKCEFEGCAKSFKKSIQLKKHLCCHTNEKMFRCEVEGCEAGFMSLSGLRRHMNKHNKGYLCGKPGCAEAFETFSKLRVHMRSHGFACEHCDKSFKEISELKKHSVIHSDDRKMYNCPMEGCSRSYTKPFNLKQHIRSFHEGQKPHVCTVEGCGKAYVHKVSLLQHQELHAQGKWRPDPPAKEKATKKVRRLAAEKKTKKRRKPVSLARKLSGYRSSHSESSDTVSVSKRRKASFSESEDAEVMITQKAARPEGHLQQNNTTVDTSNPSRVQEVYKAEWNGSESPPSDASLQGRISCELSKVGGVQGASDGTDSEDAEINASAMSSDECEPALEVEIQYASGYTKSAGQQTDVSTEERISLASEQTQAEEVQGTSEGEESDGDLMDASAVSSDEYEPSQEGEVQQACGYTKSEAQQTRTVIVCSNVSELPQVTELQNDAYLDTDIQQNFNAVEADTVVDNKKVPATCTLTGRTSCETPEERLISVKHVTRNEPETNENSSVDDTDVSSAGGENTIEWESETDSICDDLSEANVECFDETMNNSSHPCNAVIAKHTASAPQSLTSSAIVTVVTESYSKDKEAGEELTDMGFDGFPSTAIRSNSNRQKPKIAMSSQKLKKISTKKDSSGSRPILIPDRRIVRFVTDNSPLCIKKSDKTEKNGLETFEFGSGSDFPDVDDLLQVIIEEKDSLESENEVVSQGDDIDSAEAGSNRFASPPQQRLAVSGKEQSLEREAIASITCSEERGFPLQEEHALKIQQNDVNLGVISAEEGFLAAPPELRSRMSSLEEERSVGYSEDHGHVSPEGYESVSNEARGEKVVSVHDKQKSLPSLENCVSKNTECGEITNNAVEETGCNVSGKKCNFEITKLQSGVNQETVCSRHKGSVSYRLSLVESHNVANGLRGVPRDTTTSQQTTAPLHSRGKVSVVNCNRGPARSSNKRKSLNLTRLSPSTSFRTGQERHVNRTNQSTSDVRKQEDTETLVESEAMENPSMFSDASKNIHAKEVQKFEVSKTKFRRKANSFLQCDLKSLELLWNFKGK